MSLTNSSSTRSEQQQASILLGALTLVCCLLYWLAFDNVLAYQRTEILDGEIWRLLTGNLLHTNHWHLLMNLAGLWVIYGLFTAHFKPIGLLTLLGFLCVFEGLGLLVFYPQTLGYVGLSGVLHGLFSFGAVLDIKTGIKMGRLLVAGVLAKVIYEQVAGPSQDVAQLIGARVATESHLVGMIMGLLCALVWILYLNYQTK